MATRVLLPKDVRPLKYHLHLTPNLPAFTFDGQERVEVEVKESTNKIVIHANDIQVSSAHFTSDGNKVQAKSITFQKEEETVTFEFENALKVGAGELEVHYQGNLNDKMAGFYRSKYVVNNETRYMATTQFEPTEARRAFPCWDEPAIKAIFEITLAIPEKLTALSNMPVAVESSASGVKTVKFTETPIMSTYLVAFIVGEFDYVQGETKENILVRVYTPLGKKDQGTFALDVAIKTLSYFSEYFGLPYPLPKLDMVAIADFAAGAMENWGLVTYRETALLVDQKSSGVSSKQRVAYVVAHELAHQWFGNIVTMEWWKELWLNEGFATFVGNQAVDFLFPEWDIWTQFASQYFNRALDLDGLESSHPIEVEVNRSSEINEIFDAISYCKGASVIRMIATHLGEASFRKGLNIYLNRHKYKNAVTEDLWDALSESSGFDVKDFMDNWTKSTGYPLVSIENAPTKDHFHVHQSRFFANGKVEEDSKESQKWWIALTIYGSKIKDPVKYDLKEQKDTINLPNSSECEWIKVNSGQSGFYRVKYSADLVEKLTKAINNLELPTVDRLGIQNDAFALAKAGFLQTTGALTIAKAYRNEKDYTVWSDLAASLGDMAVVWSAEPNYPHMKNFIRTLFTPISQSLGWEPIKGESDLQTLLRPVVLSQLGGNDDPEVIEEAKKKFNNYLKDKDSVPADLRYLVYKLAVANGGSEEWEAVLNIFRTAEMSEEKVRALRALGQTRNPDLITKTLELSLTDEVRAQDIFYATISASATPAGREITWKFLQDSWSGFEKRLGDSQFLLGRIISYATKDFASADKAKEVEKFFSEHKVPQAERTIKQSIESILANAKWLETNREAVAKWLAEQ